MTNTQSTTTESDLDVVKLLIERVNYWAAKLDNTSGYDVRAAASVHLSRAAEDLHTYLVRNPLS